MNNKIKNEARDIITIGLAQGKKQTSSSNNKLAINDIDNLKDSLQNTDKLEDFFENTFFIDNFKVLNDSASSNITAENFIQTQAEVTLLRKIQIELIQFVNEDTQLDGNAIIKAFQASEVYKKYFDEKGINTKLNEYKETNLGPIPTFNGLINIKDKLPNLEIKENRDFDNVAQDLKNYIGKLQDIQFATLQPSQDNLDKITMITLKSDPLLLAMMTKTETGQGMQIEMEKQSFGTKAGKFVLISLLLVATCAAAAVITGLAAPAIVTALGGAALTKLGVGVATGMVMTGVGALSTKIGKEIDKIGNKNEENLTKSDIVKKIQGIDINNQQSKRLLKDFHAKTEKNVTLSVKKETKIGI